jgi:hypothetical protein
LTLTRFACSFAEAMRISLRFWLPILGAVLQVGCVQQDGSTTSSSGGSSGPADAAGDTQVTRAGQACLDTANAFATAQARCGEDYAAERAAFIRDLAGGDCETVTIRNETELRTQCFPSLAGISCADLVNGRLSPSCAGQILREK